ncbi:tetratricopeptide repeat protein [Paraflavisolibacter sp. H34]|uniref:tetratricopeptide repeat protein n=1 Tax=Huijunlia imazamoxiresistens TaxID=3127457 RepID=UPI00301745EA
MKKTAIVLFFSAALSVPGFAQNVQEGKKHLNAERYQSAKEVFEKLLAANPKNAEASYWLGQTYIKMKDSATAVSHYQSALSANSNAPLVLVGAGQIDLMQGKSAEAKQKFETAISLAKGKKGTNPDVLAAIGRANVDARTGDLAYGIEKLNEAAKSAPNNAEVYFALGNAYRKAHEGGPAVTNYMKATQMDAAYALPYYRMARIYQTQQPYSDIVLTNLNNAVAADAKFAPAYLDLYYYYLLYAKDFAKAEEFANKYISSTDPSVENDYLKAQTIFVQKKYDEAIAIGKNIVEKAGDKANPRVYRLLAYSNLEKGDTAAARPFVEQFFTKADQEDIVPADYIMRADAYASENPDIVLESYLQGAKLDTVPAKQVQFLNQGIDRFTKSGNKSAVAALREASFRLRGADANPTELISYMAVPYYQAGNFQKADSVSKAYITMMPDSIYGHIWSARSLARIDTSMEQGLAIDAYNKLLDVASKDKVRFKSYGVEAAGYLAGYYNNVKKEKDTAVTYLKRALEFDPENASIKNNITILEKPAAAPKPATKPAAPKKPGAK